MRDMAWLEACEARANERGQADRELYRSHRERLTALLASFAVSHPRLCLLGAGNCNDVELDLLSQLFEEICLIDLDEKALERSLLRLPEAARARVRCRAPVDLSGIFDELELLQRDLGVTAASLRGPGAELGVGSAKAEAAAQRWIDLASAKVLARIDESFDLAVSCCVSTQLSWALTELLGRQPKLAMDILLGTHLRVLLGLVAQAPAPAALWITDLSSSSLYPIEEALAVISPRALRDLVVERGHIYRGSSPEVITRWLERDPALLGFGKKGDLEPWLWRTRSRSYLVTATEFVRLAR